MKFYKLRNRYTSKNKALKLKNCRAVRPEPPSTNRGAHSPQQIETIDFDKLCRADYNGMLASIDWLEFTVFNMEHFLVIEQILGLPLSDFEDTGRGAMGYLNKLQAYWGDVRVLFGSKNPDMGVHVSIPGKGCHALFSRIMPSDLIQNILSFNCKVTRIDLALDNIGDVYFYPYELRQFVNDGLVKSQWRSLCINQTVSIQSADLTGDTVYLGSRSSDLFCRVYDKTMERIYRKDDKDLPENWVRWELVCKDDRAQVACEQLLSTGFAIGNIIAGVLSNYFTILDRNPNDSHKHRWPVNQRWQRFLGDVSPIRLYRVLKKEKTLEDSADWIKSQCAPTISALMRVYGEDWLIKEIGLNAWRMNKRLARITLDEAERIRVERKNMSVTFS